MADFILIGDHTLINTRRIMAAVSVRSQPIQRLLKTYPRERLFDLTFGYPRSAVLLFDNGRLGLISLNLTHLSELLKSDEEVIRVRPEG